MHHSLSFAIAENVGFFPDTLRVDGRRVVVRAARRVELCREVVVYGRGRRRHIAPL